MKYINQIFFKGLIVVLPITLTLYLLFWASLNIESLFASGLKLLVGEEVYIPGLGILLTFVFVFLVGLLVNNYLTGRVFIWLTRALEKVPLFKVIYNPLKDLMSLLPGKSQGKNRPQRVVLIPLGETGLEALGLVTREDLDELPGEGLISVFVPLSYMLGGVTVLVKKDKVKKVDMPVDQALKLSVTAWIKATDKERE